MSTPVPSAARIEATFAALARGVDGRAARVGPSTVAARDGLALVALACASLACASRGEPAAPQPLVGSLSVTTACWTGGVLSGPRALAVAQVASAPVAEPKPSEPGAAEDAPQAAEPEAATSESGGPPPEAPPQDAPPVVRARRVRITVDALDQKLPGGTPLVRRSALIANVSGAVALSVDNPLLLGGRVASGGEAVAWQRAAAGISGPSSEVTAPPRVERIAAHDLIVLPDAAFGLSLGAIDVERAPGDAAGELAARGPFPQRVDVLVGANAGRLEVGVAVQRLETRSAEGEPETLLRSEHGAEVPVHPLHLRRDVALLLDEPLVGGTPLAVVLPSPLDAGSAKWLLVMVEGQGEPPNESEIERARASLAAADTLLAAIADAPNEDRIAEANALLAIETGEGRRTALLVLADQRGSALAAELALALDDAALAAFASRLRAAGVAPGEDIGWQLEREALLHAAAMLAGEDVPLALESVLVRRAGHAGRFAVVLEEAAASASLADADAWLTKENVAYLEDSDPSARVRAYDWLARRGAAPAGYGPLASPEARRAALRAARTAAGDKP